MPRRKTEYRNKLLADTEYTVTADRPLVLPEGAPATIEVGMGSGKVLVMRAASEPERFFVGVELKEERAWQALRDARALGLKNVRFIAMPVAMADRLLPSDRFDEVVVLFPDPWPREHDERRRLVAPQQLRLYARWMKTGARGVFRTDSAPLFAYGKETIASRGFPILRAESDVPPGQISTKYEAIWRAKRLAIHELVFERPERLPDDPRDDAPVEAPAAPASAPR